MNLFTKPCGCRGTGLFQKTWKGLENVTKDFQGWNEDAEPHDRILTTSHERWPTYTSTELICREIEEETIERDYYEVEKKTYYLKYGCLKCGETWREKQKERTNREWSKE